MLRALPRVPTVGRCRRPTPRSRRRCRRRRQRAPGPAPRPGSARKPKPVEELEGEPVTDGEAPFPTPTRPAWILLAHPPPAPRGPPLLPRPRCRPTWRRPTRGSTFTLAPCPNSSTGPILPPARYLLSSPTGSRRRARRWLPGRRWVPEAFGGVTRHRIGTISTTSANWEATSPGWGPSTPAGPSIPTCSPSTSSSSVSRTNAPVPRQWSTPRLMSHPWRPDRRLAFPDDAPRRDPPNRPVPA